MRREELADLVRPLAEEEGVEFVSCDVSRGPRTQSFRIFIDREEGLSIDACGQLSRRIARILDANPAIRGAYHLEVSSPGMNRPIWKLEHFQRFSGEKARIELKILEGPRVLDAEIGAIEGDGVWLLLPKAERKFVRLDEIETAQLRMDPWKRKAKAERRTAESERS